MPTRVNFINDKPIVFAEELDNITNALREGAALVHLRGHEERALLLPYNITYLEELKESAGPAVAFAE